MTFTLRQARVLRGLTQEEMAHSLQIHRSTYRKLEQNPVLATLAQGRAIARMTGVPLDQIFFGAISTKSSAQFFLPEVERNVGKRLRQAEPE